MKTALERAFCWFPPWWDKRAGTVSKTKSKRDYFHRIWKGRISHEHTYVWRKSKIIVKLVLLPFLIWETEFSKVQTVFQAKIFFPIFSKNLWLPFPNNVSVMYEMALRIFKTSWYPCMMEGKLCMIYNQKRFSLLTWNNCIVIAVWD